MNKYYISTYKDQHYGGGKARTDINKILKNRGYSEILIPQTFNKKLLIKILKDICSVPPKSIIILHSPISFKIGMLVLLVSRILCFKLVIIIHDIEELRKIYIHGEKNIFLERLLLKNSSSIICHNKNMANYLKKQGLIENKIVILDIFDYLADSNSSFSDIINKEIINIAGNMSSYKSPYIYLLHTLKIKACKFRLYGPEYEKNQQDSSNIEYCGVYTSDDIIYQLQTGWGLAWDGDSIEGCTGNTGNYLPYCNQHKVSLYLAAGLPVIIWDKSGLASLVEKNHVGITVNSLRDIEGIITNISDEEYAIMRQNAIVFSKKLREGFFFKRAIEKVEKILL